MLLAECAKYLLSATSADAPLRMSQRCVRRPCGQRHVPTWRGGDDGSTRHARTADTHPLLPPAHVWPRLSPVDTPQSTPPSLRFHSMEATPMRRAGHSRRPAVIRRRQARMMTAPLSPSFRFALVVPATNRRTRGGREESSVHRPVLVAYLTYVSGLHRR